MISISNTNFIRASLRNIELASRIANDAEFLKAEAKRVTGDARKTGWLRRDAKTLLSVCAAEGVTIERPYKVATIGDKRALLTVFWPDHNRVVLVPAKFY
ncbi:MAG: hypothetical protein JSR68_08285 [Proteobacteria bacterium]|nr:hypothetical protein [Pseudomonadota bacterium]